MAPLVAHELVGRDAEPVREVPRGQADMLTLGAEPGGGSEEARLVGRLHGRGREKKTPATGWQGPERTGPEGPAPVML